MKDIADAQRNLRDYVRELNELNQVTIKKIQSEMQHDKERREGEYNKLMQSVRELQENVNNIANKKP